MRTFIKTIFAFNFIWVLIPSSSLADFDKGLEAFKQKDFETAMREWLLDANQGNSDGQYNIGSMYENGQGVTMDFIEAARWYRLAAEQGAPEAQFTLGIIYYAGELYREGSNPDYSGPQIKQDYVEAAKWTRQAVKQGLAKAQYWLAEFFYQSGIGVPRSDAETVKWLMLAAEQGYIDAQFALASSYWSGKGIQENKVLAYMWVNLAAGNGHGFAVESRREFRERMTTDQISEAEKLSVEWFETHQK